MYPRLLPRQAQDKHKDDSTKRRRFFWSILYLESAGVPDIKSTRFACSRSGSIVFVRAACRQASGENIILALVLALVLVVAFEETELDACYLADTM